MKRISEEHLAILSMLEFEGNAARITEQLDRKTYVAINKILVSAGGNWNRKAKAHLFPDYAEEILDPIITTGEYATARDTGFFPTPDALARQLVADADVVHGDIVLEPSAGAGNIVKVLQEAGAKVTAIEVDDIHIKKLCALGEVSVMHTDFLDFSPAGRLFDKIVMNPPFAKTNGFDQLDHVRHAWKCLEPGGTLVSVLSNSVTFRKDKRYREFRMWCEEVTEEAFDTVCRPLPSQSFKASGTGVQTVVLKMQKEETE